MGFHACLLFVAALWCGGHAHAHATGDGGSHHEVNVDMSTALLGLDRRHTRSGHIPEVSHTLTPVEAAGAHVAPGNYLPRRSPVKEQDAAFVVPTATTAATAATATADSTTTNRLRVHIWMANDNALPAHVQRYADDGTVLQYMYEPVVSTLEAGLHLAPREVRAVLDIQEVVVGGQERFDELSKLGKGDVFIWVGEIAMGQVPFQTLNENGVFTVYYQTEPAHKGCMCTAAHQANNTMEHDDLTGRVESNNHTDHVVSSCVVDEMWDFSWYNIDQCVGLMGKRAPVQRYVPLAAGLVTPTVRQQPPSDHTKLCFLGNPNYGRKTCWSYLLGTMPENSLYSVYNIWSHTQFADLLRNETSGVFLNIHKNCTMSRDDALNPVTWRNPKLLNAHGIVLSDRCYYKDEAEYDGMIFFHEVKDIPAAFRALTLKSAEEREAIARDAYTRFLQRFPPEAIFGRAHVYELLSSLIKQRLPLNDPSDTHPQQ